MSPQDPEIARTESTSGESALSLVENQPGVLRGVVTLTLETHQAHRLVKGRSGTAEKPAIIGLIGFANLLRVIWHGARAGDPFADWWLIKVHNALEWADRALNEAIGTVQTRLAAIEAIRVTPGASVRPVHIPLRFSNPYAYRGAHLVAQYDRLVRAALTAQHIGVMTRDDAARVLAFGGRQLRRAFLSPMGYHLTGITRADVIQGTVRKSQAQASMGEVPLDILSGDLRAPHAPIRAIPGSEVSAHLNLHALPSKMAGVRSRASSPGAP